MKAQRKKQTSPENRKTASATHPLMNMQRGLGGESCTGVKPRAVFEGGMERTHCEPNEQQSDKSEQNLQKVIFLKPFGGHKRDIRRFAKMCFPQPGEALFKKCDAKSESEHKKYERGILKLALSMQIRTKVHRTQFFCMSLGTCRAK